MSPKNAYCAVPGCINKGGVLPGRSYFRLPSNPERADLWLKNTNIDVKLTARKRVLICEVHFEKRFVSINSSRRRLLTYAVPTLYLPRPLDSDPPAAEADTASDEADPQPPDAESSRPYSSDINIKPDPDELTVIPSINNFQFEDEPEPKRIKTGLESHEIVICWNPEHNYDHLLVGSGKHIAAAEASTWSGIHATSSQRDPGVNITEVINMYDYIHAHSEGDVFTDDFKLFSLNLYYTNPSAYQVFRNQLKLPPISELYSLHLPKSTQLDENVVKALKLKVDRMTDDERQCAICLGSMPLTAILHYDKEKDTVTGFNEVDGLLTLEPANLLHVTFVRGLFHDWKQVISYSFVAHSKRYKKDVKAQLDKIIEIMFEIGLNVRVLITDRESEVINTLNMNIIPERPYFVANNRKIYYMYDPPHLMRWVRDSLLKHDLRVQDNVVKWSYISKFFNIDKERSLRLVPKLNIHHMSPKSFDKLKVGVAAEIFSKTTATGMSVAIDLNWLGTLAAGTVEFISNMSRLLEMLNFSSFAETGSNTFSGERSQVEFLNEMMIWLVYVRPLGQGLNEFLEPFQITIKAIIALHSQFEKENRISRRPLLNRDCMDVFIEKLTETNPRPPTCHDMQSLIRMVPIFNIFQWAVNSKGSTDLQTFLEVASEIPEDVYEPEDEDITPALGEFSTSIDFSELKLPEQHRLQYFAAYLLYEALQRHQDCAVMNKYVLRESDESHLNIKTEIDDDPVCSVSAPADFVRWLNGLELKLREYLKEHMRKKRLLGSMIDHMHEVPFLAPCACFPTDFIKELYARYKWYLLLDYNNHQYKYHKNRLFFKIVDVL